MNSKRTRRKAYRPRPVHLDMIEHTIALACKLAPQQRAAFRQPLRVAFNGLRTGVGAQDAWCQLADAMNVAEQLALRKIASDRLPEILAAQEALHDVHQRHAQRGTWTLRATELAALRLGRFFHFVQVDHCTQLEMRDSIDAVRRRVQQALAGNAPRNAKVCVGQLGHQHTAPVAQKAAA